MTLTSKEAVYPYLSTEKIKETAEGKLSAAPAEDSRLAEPLQATAAREDGYSVAGELEKLTELHSSGAITDEEFSKAKNKVLE